MRKSKKTFYLTVIGAGIILLLVNLIAFQAEAFIGIGTLLITWGTVDFAFEHFIHKVRQARILDDDERNILIKGKAYTITSEFSAIGLSALGLYLYLKHDMTGLALAVILFLIQQIVFTITFRYFDRH